MLTSDTLNDKRSSVYYSLLNILTKCHTLICTDADVSNLVFMLIHKCRPNYESTIYVDSPLKGYGNITAYNYKNENELIEKLKQSVKNKQYFLCCFDYKKTMDAVYTELLNSAPDQKDKFLLYSSDKGDKADFSKVSKKWVGHYVMYSPKIIYGLDFNPPEKTDVFLFCGGGVINSLQMAQQMTRCRNIKNIYFHLHERRRPIQYTSVKKLKDHYSFFIDKYEKFLTEHNMIIRGDTGAKLADDFFAELFFQNHFYNHVLESNYMYHFLRICEQKGITIKDVGEYMIMDKEKKKELNTIVEKNNDKTFNDLIERRPDINEKDPFAVQVIKRKNILQLSWDELKENECYKQIVKDNGDFSDHLCFSKLIMNIDEKQSKYNLKTAADFKEITTKSADSKILFCASIENELKIDTLDINYKKNSNKFDIEIDDKCHIYFKTYDNLFPTSKKKNKQYDGDLTWNDLYTLLIKCYKHLCGNEVVTYDRKKKGKNTEQITKYNINPDYVSLHVPLILRRGNYNKLNKAFVENNNIEPPIDKPKKQINGGKSLFKKNNAPEIIDKIIDDFNVDEIVDKPEKVKQKIEVYPKKKVKNKVKILPKDDIKIVKKRVIPIK